MWRPLFVRSFSLGYLGVEKVGLSDWGLIIYICAGAIFRICPLDM